ncbi:protein brambleberry-like [Littorina saxatilis]|uniref:Protein brambleberry n=1 Tax=Littorina saxatilis TaxID=31220 RepID=A0AAN9AVR7_9CAEN
MSSRFKLKHVLFVFLFLQNINGGVGMFEWLFGSEKTKASENGDSEEPITRFEVLSADEKFLDFATTLADLSPLDACYHVVIYQLKKKCSDMTEEELGKLSVQLLNCQSEVEKRAIFPCSSAMTLAECTKTMDAVTWNTYQIVGNRARAMCYATQQLQFRKLAEKTVNQLAAATSVQLQAMQELKSGQEDLHQMATDTVRRLFESHQELFVTHEKMRTSQAHVFTSVADNVKQLQEEKALIAAGNQQLAQLAEKIRAELNTTARLIKSQEAAQQEKHEAILKDLKLIHNQASEALARLDASSERLLSHHDTLQRRQEEVFDNLQKINTTVLAVMTTVLDLQTQMEQRISWVTQILGGADDKLEVLQCCVLHLAYFLLVVVVAAFLHTPVMTRVIMMVVVVSNMAGQLTHHSSLDFAGLTVFITTIILGQWLLKKMSSIARSRSCGGGGGGVAGRLAGLTFSAGSDDSSALSPAEVRQLTALLQRLSHTVQETLGAETVANGSVPRSQTAVPPAPSPQRHPCEPTRSATFPTPGPSGDAAQHFAAMFRTVVDEGGASNRSSRASTPASRMSRSSTPSVSSRCLGHTLAGGQCRLSATPGSDYCRLHVPAAE